MIGGVLVFSGHTLINNIHLGVAPTWKNFLIAIPVGMIAYTGIETISNMAEEAKDETKTIPKAINRVVIAVFAIYACLPAVALSALPVVKVNGQYQTLLGVSEANGGFAGDPVLGIVKHLNLGPLQHAGEIYVGLLAATILFIATNAGIIGVSRLVYSMGLHRQVPEGLRRLHPKYRTPWIGIILFGAIACLTIIPGQATFLGNMYAFGAMLSFTIAHISVIRLRIKEPDRARPYRGPGTVRIAGRPLPVFALLGGLGTFLAFVTVTVLHLAVAGAGVGWLTIGILIYIVYRRQQGLDLTTTTKVKMVGPAADSEAEYDSVLVAFDETGFDPSADGDRGPPGGPPTPWDPRPGHDRRPRVQSDRRRPARAGGGRPIDHRGGQGAGRPPRVGPLGQGQGRADGTADRRRGTGCARRGDRDADVAFGRRLRARAGNGATRAALPGDH